jgi:hypothetical protein
MNAVRTARKQLRYVDILLDTTLAARCLTEKLADNPRAIKRLLATIREHLQTALESVVRLEKLQ